MTAKTLLAFGKFRRKERIELGVIAQQASLELQVVESWNDASKQLEQEAPHALLVEDSGGSGSRICLHTRSQVSHVQTPIISLARGLDDLSFAEVFNWGGDDVVELNPVWPLLSRIRSLPTEAAPVPARDRGVAVVSDPDRGRRVVRARVLRNAGYRIQFALDGEETREFARQADAKLVVVDSELSDAFPTTQQSATANPEVTHIFLCPPRKIAEYSTELQGLSNAVATDGFAPPENVVFLANELSRGAGRDNRSSRRLLYGTKVAFRGDGREHDDFGFSYNISAGGLYVRTLAPPADERVWLELRPPRSDRWVRLEGQVVWRRAYGPSFHATVPPGFGVKLIDATRKNMATWLDGYRQFERAVAAH